MIDKILIYRISRVVFGERLDKIDTGNTVYTEVQKGFFDRGLAAMKQWRNSK